MSINIYMDGVANITMIDGVVRIQLVTVSEINSDNTGVKTEVAETLVTTLPGLLRTYEQMTSVINKLIEQGVLKKKEPDAPIITDTSRSNKKPN